MPVYECQCSECGKIEEAFQKMSDPPLKECKKCKGKLKKLISHSSFHLKGSGWYVTDYGGSNGRSKGKSDSVKKSVKADTKISKPTPKKGVDKK